MAHTGPRPARCCAFVGAEVDAARAWAELRQAGIPAVLEGGAGNAAAGALDPISTLPEGRSSLARVMVPPADRERAAAVMAVFACGQPEGRPPQE